MTENLENQEQFNQPKVVVDLEKHRQKKNELREKSEEKEELDILRKEVGKIKDKVAEMYEKEGESPYFFVGTEIFEVEPEELTDEDLKIYKQLKEYKRGKLGRDDFFRNLSRHRYNVAKYTIENYKKDPYTNSLADSRVNFLAWMQNKLVEEEVRKMKKGKEKQKEQAN